MKVSFRLNRSSLINAEFNLIDNDLISRRRRKRSDGWLPMWLIHNSGELSDATCSTQLSDKHVHVIKNSGVRYFSTFPKATGGLCISQSSRTVTGIVLLLSINFEVTGRGRLRGLLAQLLRVEMLMPR